MNGDPTLRRFVLLQVARLTGALAALLGVVIMSRAQPALARIPDAVGGTLLVAGAVEFFLVPFILAKHWKRFG
jgi:hypothetical protein